MFLRTVAVTILTVLIASSSFANGGVGSSLPFLLISPSVRGIAMGGTTVTSLDNRSYSFNPGTLALIDIDRVALSFNPITPKLSSIGGVDFKVHSEALAVRLVDTHWGEGSFTLAFGYMFTTYSVGPFQVTTPSFPDGTGRFYEVTNRDHSFSIGAGYKGSFELGLGTTVRYIYEDILDVNINGFAFDVGTVFRMPLVGSLSGYDLDSDNTRLAVRTGISITNMGSGLKSSGSGFAAPLPTRGRFGLGFDFASKWLSLAPTLEVTVANNNAPGDLRLGIEAGLNSTVFLRAGRLKENDNGISETSYGFGFTTRQIRKSAAESAEGLVLEPKTFLGYLVRNINLTFSFAHLDTERIGFDNPNFYQIELTL